MKNKKALKILDIFLAATNNIFNDHLKEWKEKGGKINGYTCSYMPEEIFSAANSLPLRLRGRREANLENIESYMGQFTCSYVTHLFESILKEDLDFVDCFSTVSTCDYIRRIYDNIKHLTARRQTSILGIPKKTGPAQIDYFRQQLEEFKKELEVQNNVKITDDRLWEAIKLHNKTRFLQKELYDLRKQDKPPITGAETLAVMIAGTAMPKEKYNGYLRELIDELRTENDDNSYRARLMVVGPAIDDPEFFKVIENTGGLIVTDSICFGTRLCFNQIDESGNDPMSAITQYYLTIRPGCPHSTQLNSQRADEVIKMKKDFSVDGVIGARLKFCENWGLDHYLLGNFLKEDDTPYLVLDTEYKLSGRGQLQTRVQAFLEVIEGDK